MFSIKGTRGEIRGIKIFASKKSAMECKKRLKDLRIRDYEWLDVSSYPFIK